METKEQTKIIRKEYLREDSKRRSKNGVWTIKRNFFYRGKESENVFAEEAKAILKEKGIEIGIIKAEENWNTWPKESYWLVEFVVVNR